MAHWDPSITKVRGHTAGVVPENIVLLWVCPKALLMWFAAGNSYRVIHVKLANPLSDVSRAREQPKFFLSTERGSSP